MKSIELFAGIGGIALAAEWAGIETVAFCERDPFCQKVLKKHWMDVPIFDDVRTLNRKTLEENGVIEPNGTVELISGGFPCQPFSIAGKQRGKEDDRDLWPEMFRIIKELKPRWIVGENVANFANMELDRTLFDLESIGYRWRTFVIPACAVNAKHERKRTFVVAYSDSKRNNSKEEYRTNRNRTEKVQERELPQLGFSNNSIVFSDSDSERLERCEDTRKTSGKGKKWNQQFTGRNKTGATWSVEPNVGRVAHGIPNRVDRIRSLGNAVVPQQIYPIFEAIRKVENQ